MCRKVECSACGKASWKGCGQHIETALAGVPNEERCPGWRTGICVGPPAPAAAPAAAPAPAAPAAPAAGPSPEEQLAQYEEQQREIQEQQNSAAMIGEVEPCSALLCVYLLNPQPGFAQGINNYLSRVFAGIRRVRGDGNCFYRAFLFAYLESIIATEQGSGAELARFKAAIVASKNELVAVGYEEMAIETFYDMMLELLDKVAAGMTAAELFAAFQEESGESDYWVWYMRLMTACALKRDAPRFEPFIPDAACADIGEFCAKCVEPMKTECEHLQILALSEYVGVRVQIHYLDGKPCGEGESLVVHKFPSEGEGEGQGEGQGGQPCVHLLYRPGHYDILVVA